MPKLVIKVTEGLNLDQFDPGYFLYPSVTFYCINICDADVEDLRLNIEKHCTE